MAATLPFSGSAVESIVLSTVEAKLPAYLDMVGLQKWRGVTNRNRLDHWSEDQLPVLGIVCPGLAEEPRPLARHTYEFLTRWAVGVAIVVSARDTETTRTLAQAYTACIRNCMMHNPGQLSQARGTDWLDERYDPLDWDDAERSLGAGQVQLAVEFHVRMGPAPDDVFVQATSTELEMELLPLEDQ
jgi:hypothetical protein